MDNSREYCKVIEYVHNKVSSGEIHTGDKLPPERAIADLLSVSRNAAREGLKMLENMGVIESRRGSGNYLAGDMSKSIADIIDMMLLLSQISTAEICSFRKNMETAICFSIIENGTYESLEGEVPQLLEGFLQLDPAAQAEADSRFHYLLSCATKNRLWVSIMDSISIIYKRCIYAAINSAGTDTKKELHSSHLELYSALLNRDFTSCLKAINRHYDIIDIILKS